MNIRGPTYPQDHASACESLPRLPLSDEPEAVATRLAAEANDATDANERVALYRQITDILEKIHPRNVYQVRAHVPLRSLPLSARLCTSCPIPSRSYPVSNVRFDDTKTHTFTHQHEDSGAYNIRPELHALYLEATIGRASALVEMSEVDGLQVPPPPPPLVCVCV